MKKRCFFCSIIICLFFLFISCTSTYKSDINNPSDELLLKNKSIAIATSEDGYYGSDVYTGSGKALSTIIKRELKPYSNNIRCFDDKEIIDHFSSEELEKYDYIVIPEILHWEDRATAWSGIPDKVEVSIDIFNSKRELIKSGVLSGKSASMTFGSTDPTALLNEPLKSFFDSIFE